MKRRTDNEKKSNKKKAVIAGLVAGISTVVLAFGLYMNYSKKDVPAVETNNPSIESVTENENPDINDVIKDSTQMDIKIEGVDAETEQSYSGVSDEDVGDVTEQESIVETTEITPADEENSIVDVEETTEVAEETTEKTEETAQTAPEQTKEETTQTAPEETKPVEQAKESTEVQPVYKEETPAPAPSGGNGGSSGGNVSQQDVDALFDSWGIEDGGSGYNTYEGSVGGITWQ